MKINLFLLSSLILLWGCLSNSSKKNSTIVNKDNSEIVKDNTNKTQERKVLYSTDDLMKAKMLSRNEFSNKFPSIPMYEEEFDEEYFIIGKYKEYHIIIKKWTGDQTRYYMGCVKTKLFHLDDGADVSPEWGEPENEMNCYDKRKFELYSDFLLKIDIEEKRPDSIKKVYAKYYRINNQGKFYEVKEQ